MAHVTAGGSNLSNRCRRRWAASAIWILLAMVALPACVQDSDIPLDYAMTSADKLAQQLNNSLANLITVPAPAGRDKVNAGFVQLALAYTAPTRTTMFASIESSFNGSENNGRCRCNWG